MFPPENTPTDTFPYHIDEQVGSGSMGVVYRAKDVALDRTVAIKALRSSVLSEEPADVQQEMRNRFRQEAQAAGRLSHPGITTVHMVGVEGGTPFIVMEWLEGRTLQEILEERGRLEIGEAVRLGVALLEALDAAHRTGVVHRDLKPANLVILKDGRLKVTDFGIAHVQQEKELVKTKAGVVLATPRFASPEQLRGSEVDARSDLFAVGVLLYHMTTGHFPFAGKSFLDLASSIMQKEPAPLRDHLAEVPPGLEAVVKKALHKSRKERFENAREMIEALTPFLGAAGDLGTSSAALPSLTGTGSTSRVLQLHRDLPDDPRLAIVHLVETWTGQELPRQSTRALLERLLDKPLHAPAFAGAVRIGPICLFLEDGMLLGAVDTTDSSTGDAVAERVPETAGAVLHPLPQGYPERFNSLLTTVLHPPQRRQSQLDSSFINLPALAQKLNDEKFSGLLRFERGPAWTLIYFLDGEQLLSLFSEGWDDVPIDHSWSRWVANYPVIAHVEEKVVVPLGDWYRHALRDLTINVELVDDKKNESDPGRTTGSRVRELLKSPRGALDSSRTVRLALHLSSESASRCGDIDYEQSPLYRFLAWALGELPRHFAERDKVGSWRYLVEWLSLVRQARLYHELPRPDSRQADFFDLVTADEQGKVLHVAGRTAALDEKSFRDFLDRVRQAKASRVKTGDIGGAFLIAPSFDDATLEAYDEVLKGAQSGSWFGLEEALTGYEGFVRMGPRRGFHLLLVEEDEDGFRPLIPG